MYWIRGAELAFMTARCRDQPIRQRLSYSQEVEKDRTDTVWTLGGSGDDKEEEEDGDDEADGDEGEDKEISGDDDGDNEDATIKIQTRPDGGNMWYCKHASGAPFQLIITFSTEQFTDGQPSPILLVYFSGALDFASHARNYLPEKRYTQHLSELVYVQQLYDLDYTLTLCPYAHSGILGRSRLRKHQRFGAIRQNYIVTDDH